MTIAVTGSRTGRQRLLWIVFALGMIACDRVSVIAASDLKPSPPRKLIERAIGQYQSALDETDRGRRVQSFAQAETLFQQAIRQQQEQSPDQTPSADLLLNHGNAALGAEHLGVAIAAYRKALERSPGNRRAAQNLDHARSLLPQWIPKPESTPTGLGSIGESLTRAATYAGAAASALFLLAALLLACYFRFDWKWARAAAALVGLIWLLCLLTHFRPDATDRFAVVTAPEATARSADSYNAPASISKPLVSGTELRLLDDRGEWVHAELADGRRCWLPSTTIERI